MNCFVVAADPEASRVRALARLAQDLGYTIRYVRDVEALARDRSFSAARSLVLIPDPIPDALAAIELAGAAKNRAFVVVVADTMPLETYKTLTRSGSGEWIAWATWEDELRDLGRRLEPLGTNDRSAKVIALLPSKGGVGNTRIALEIGLYLASRKSAGRTAVLDLNVQGGTLADALDLEPRFDIGEIVESPDRLDEQLIDIFTSRYRAQFDVLACPARRIPFADIPPAIIFTLLDALARRYETILIDLPRIWIPWIDNLLEGSDVVLVTAEATVPGLRALTATLSGLDGLSLDRSRLAAAVNLCDTDFFGRISRRAEIEQVLAAHTVHCVRRDDAAARNAADSGQALMETAPGLRISRDLRGVAEWCSGAAGLTRGGSQ